MQANTGPSLPGQMQAMSQPRASGNPPRARTIHRGDNGFGIERMNRLISVLSSEWRENRFRFPFPQFLPGGRYHAAEKPLPSPVSTTARVGSLAAALGRSISSRIGPPGVQPSGRFNRIVATGPSISRKLLDTQGLLIIAPRQGFGQVLEFVVLPKPRASL
jgi:hypothetical protein